MSLDPGGQASAVVQITLGQVYNVVTETQKEMRDLTHSVQAAVGQLSDHETRLRQVERDGATSQELDEVRKENAAQLKALKDEHGPRLSAVERRVWMTAGVALTLSVGGSGLIAYVMSAH